MFFQIYILAGHFETICYVCDNLIENIGKVAYPKFKCTGVFEGIDRHSPENWHQVTRRACHNSQIERDMPQILRYEEQR